MPEINQVKKKKRLFSLTVLEIPVHELLAPCLWASSSIIHHGSTVAPETNSPNAFCEREKTVVGNHYPLLG
jgi:hypothetical protein